MTPTQITDNLDIDQLEEELDDAKYDRITFVRDDSGSWLAKVSVEEPTSYYEAWFSLDDDHPLNDWHEVMKRAAS